MSRVLSNAMKEMAVAKVVRPIFLVRMVFDSSQLNIWSGVGDISFDSVTYTGLGDLLSISDIKETSDISATGINVSLSGVKSSLIAIAKDQDYQGRELTVRLGAFNESGSLIADPVIIFSGFMDTMTIAEAGTYSTISIAVENKIVAFERSKVRRYTAEDQKIDHPTDKGFEFVTSIVQKQIIWGRPSGSSADPTTPPETYPNEYQ